MLDFESFLKERNGSKLSFEFFVKSKNLKVNPNLNIWTVAGNKKNNLWDKQV